MIDFVRDNILNQKNIRFIAFGKLINKKVVEEKNENTIIDTSYTDKFLLYRCICLNEFRREERKYIVFKVHENIPYGIGTEISIRFVDNPKIMGYSGFPRPTEFDSMYTVRDIDISDDSDYDMKSSLNNIYYSININFLSTSSDKILNIARSKIIHKAFVAYNKIIEIQILPKVLNNIKEIFEKNYNKFGTMGIESDTLSFMYFNMQLNFFTNKYKLHSRFDEKYYNDYYLPEELCSYFSCEKIKLSRVKAIDFFEQQQVIISNISERNYNADRDIINVFDFNKYKKTLKSLLDSFKIDYKLIVWNQSYFTEYFDQNYVIDELVFSDQRPRDIVYILKKYSKDEYYNIKLAKNQLVSFFTNFMYVFSKMLSSRQIFYPIEPYANVLSVKYLQNDIFNLTPKFVKHFIISPFENSGDFDKIRRDLSELIEIQNIIGLKEILNEKYIDVLINDRLINYILGHSVFQLPKKHPEKIIKETYLEFIADMLLSSISFYRAK